MVLKVVIFFATALTAQLAHSWYFGSDLSGGLTGVLLELEGRGKELVVISCLQKHTSRFNEETKTVTEKIKVAAKKISAADEESAQDMRNLLYCVLQMEEDVWPKVVAGNFTEAVEVLENIAPIVRGARESSKSAASRNKTLQTEVYTLGKSLYDWEKNCKKMGESIKKCITEETSSNS